MLRKALLSVAVAGSMVLAMSTHSASASTININGPLWLGPLKLKNDELAKIQKAFVSALDAPIDAVQQCGDVIKDCEVRAAREWNVGKDFYREIVVNIHTVGHTSHAIRKEGDKWPTIVAK